MKLGLIFICLSILSCGSSPEEHKTPNHVVEDYNPLPGGGGSGPMPCDRVYVITITTDAGTFTKEVPVYCNPNPDPYHGDPPDYHWAVDPDPWDKQSDHREQNVRPNSGRQGSER